MIKVKIIQITPEITPNVTYENFHKVRVEMQTPPISNVMIQFYEDQIEVIDDEEESNENE